MKNLFLTIRKKSVFIVLAVFVAVAGVFTFALIKTSSTPKPQYTIVIDAGHGGKDGGAVGDNSTESFLNLQFALRLEEICKQYDFNVVQTRSDMNGLYSPLASNKKRSEMNKRKSIIEKSNPDLVVSIHMNSFPSPEVRGAQVFYAEGNESGQALAESVQNSLHKNIEYAKKVAKVGDYYILNCTTNPSILVECGFVSNPEEEKLLLDKNYIDKFCYHLMCGILMYFAF